MADHRDGPRMINALFPVLQQLPSRQQVILTQMLGVAPVGDTRGFSDDAELTEEIEEARAHLGSLLDAAK